jgi:hypothetical protein
VYVDVNPEVYFFIFDAVYKINNGQKINIKNEWNNIIQHNDDLLFGKKKIFSIFLTKNKITSRNQISYKVNWNLLEKKLEEQSKDIIKEFKRNPNVSLGILYDRLASNYYPIRNTVKSNSPIDLNKLKFKMKQIGDFDKLKQQGLMVKEMSNKIEEKYPN